ncbi:vitamin H transporter [Aspergillus bombycis]|uniref:Vitamin H transporter n=1 Tax=Aspergillus bombycis TaxID=109264 RepID=A0A1F8AD11_9EURO|nr:vitamin H transporter [Aspergillus bombycis]OGM49245.1 vitamin H transporter [Aspergillus bombycis]
MPSSPPTCSSSLEGEEEANRIRDVKSIEKHIEDVSEYDHQPAADGVYIASDDIQARFELLRELSPEQMEALNKRVLKRIDWRMMPCVTLMFLMNYLDRINVSNARLAGLQSDLNMSDTVWNAGISTFYWRGLLRRSILHWPGRGTLFPALTLRKEALPSIYWTCSKAHGLVTSSWYTKEESPMRMAIWHAGNTISNIISGFLAAGVLENMDGISGLHAWQWFFLIEGIASIIVAVASFIFLPAWPHNTPFLSEEESQMAQYRVLVSNGGRDETVGGTWDGLKDAVKDPFTWFFCLMHFALVTAQSFKDFLPSIIQTFGFDTMTTYLVQAPPYAIAYIFACAAAWSCGRLQESTWHIVIPIFISAAGCSILISTLNVGARYFGIVLLISGTYSGLNLQLSWETTVVPSPRAKKAALIAIANCISQSSHWFSPYFYPTSQEPFYRMGGGLVLMGCALVVLSAFAVNWRGRKLNKRLDEAEGWTMHSGNERGWRYKL